MSTCSTRRILTSALFVAAVLAMPIAGWSAQAEAVPSGPEVTPAAADVGGAGEVADAIRPQVDLQLFLSGEPSIGELYICHTGCTPGNEQMDCQHQLDCGGQPYMCVGATSSPCSGTCECC